MYVALQLPVSSKSLYFCIWGEKITLNNFFALHLKLIFKQWATLHLCSGLHIMKFWQFVTLHLCVYHHLYLAVQSKWRNFVNMHISTGLPSGLFDTECAVTSTLFQYQIRRLIVRYREVSKPRNLHLELSDRSEIWQAPRQHCCPCACQISKQCNNLNCQSHGFATSQDPTIRRLIWYWNGVHVEAGSEMPACLSLAATRYKPSPHLADVPRATLPVLGVPVSSRRKALGSSRRACDTSATMLHHTGPWRIGNKTCQFNHYAQSKWCHMQLS